MSMFRCTFTSFRQCRRALSTSAPRQLVIPKVTTEHVENLAPYPYGPRQWFKQADRGLYGGSVVQSGNNVTGKHDTKSRRRWYPNVAMKTLYSNALGYGIRVRVSTRVLRTIDKVGGLDEYLLSDKAHRLKELGMSGWKLRTMIMSTPTVRARLDEQRRTLGLPALDYEALEQSAAEIQSLLNESPRPDGGSSELEVLGPEDGTDSSLEQQMPQS